jgi:FMN-dependent NADH-azoreductase
MTRTILRIDASARRTGSVTRALNDRLIDRFNAHGETKVISRDLASGLPQITEDWINANFTPDADRSDAQKETLALSDDLVAELQAADTILIAFPIYNFGIPAALKAWVDLVARARVTFQYTENGPVGLLKDKRVILSVASGGTEIGATNDFATAHLTYVLGFLGITNVEVVNADLQALDAEAALQKAHTGVDSLSIAA